MRSVFDLDVVVKSGHPGEDVVDITTEVARQIEQMAAVIEQRSATRVGLGAEHAAHSCPAPIVCLTEPDLGDSSEVAGIDHGLRPGGRGP